MHGPESQDSAQLRAASFRGVIRYWYRVLYGSFWPLDHLAKEEAAIFGSRGAASKISISGESKRPRQGRAALMPHKVGADAEERGSILPGLRFRLCLKNRPWVKEKLPLEEIAWPLWLACMVGGFGQRARRGAGSLIVERIEPEITEMPVFGDCTTLAEFSERFKAGLLAAKEFAGRRCQGAVVAEAPAFPALFSESTVARVIVAPLADIIDESAARKWVMLKLRDYKDPVFGLPLKIGDKLIGGRHASPAWIRLHRLGPKWISIFSLLKPYPQGGAGLQSKPEKLDELCTALLQLPESYEVSLA
jgi:CRISPR type III-B/RAMP module RAMP protein Cmr1